MLAAALQHKPEGWTNTSYFGVRYHLFSLDRNTNEFRDVSRFFLGQQILKIERVQHPYAFGRYLLKKDQLNLGNISFNETIVFHGISAEDKTVALEYNCDSRRYKIAHDQPEFLNNFNGDCPQELVIVLKELQGCHQKSDANYYPIYVVELA